MKTFSFHFAGLFAILLIGLAPLVHANPLESGRKVAHFYEAPSDSRYLSPGREVNVQWNLLTLPEDRVMALTFDDGPVERDEEISALLNSYNIQATFFFVGNKLGSMSGIVKDVMAAGNEIGFHSYSHIKQNLISSDGLENDFSLGVAAMTKLGVHPIWFRPPYGFFNSRIIKTAREYGMETILWTIDPRDWSGVSSEVISERVIRMFHPGAVLLFHSNHAAVLQALQKIIVEAKERKYRFVTLSEWRRTIQTVHCRIQKNSCPSPLVVEGVTSPEDVVVTHAVTTVAPPIREEVAITSAVATEISSDHVSGKQNLP